MIDSAVASSQKPADLSPRARRLPIGAEYIGGGRTDVRVWAPAAQQLAVIVNAGDAANLARDEAGYFSGLIAAKPGDLHQIVINDDSQPYPDPASRFQPDGPRGQSQIVDQSAFVWADAAWRGIRIEQQVVYEMHVGTFTPAGTWVAAQEQLPELARIGITVIEVMPVAEFAGRFGWGYDGVDFFAPSHLYGTPDDLRRFINQAH